MRTRNLLAFAITLTGVLTTCIVVLTQPFVKVIPSQPPQVDFKRLATHVRHLSVSLYPRSYDQFRNTNLAAQYIFDEFTAAGGTVTVQEVAVQEVKYKNIVARFGPKSGPIMVIGAHYDSHGDANEGARNPRGYTPATHTPGADDNASGVAGLLELARLLGRTTQARPIELVAYALEEPPHFRTEHMGSAWHARSLRAANQDVELMLSLEMIGYFSEQPGSQNYPVPAMSHFYSDRGDFIALVGKLSDFGAIRRTKAVMGGATNLPVYSINAPPLLPGIDFSDHLNYWGEGFPALMITDTAFNRNHNYHMAGDTYEKLDYGRMAKVVQAVYAVTQKY
jgi:Zn-dependent M28 family amino/carboxypeptidase